MASITPSIPTGYYLTHQTVNFAVSSDVKEIAVTPGNIPPSISKYIAYDTLNPPNPFLAVTEDGRGRVVYDGGFPKFYNGASYNNAANFAGLNASCKFLHNAIHWVANAEKVAAGNKKILILGDNYVNQNYSPKSGSDNGFVNTMAMIVRVAGFTAVTKDLSDYGGILNPTLAELDQYALVILFGVNYPSSPLITAQAVNDMVSYREAGNGIIMITDHGSSNLSSPEQAAVSTGFYSTPNALATRFGAFFSGNYDRTNVNVGFLRQRYGNHPLYNNMADSEYIIAGGSESKVVVGSTTTYTPGNIPAITTKQIGINYINVLAVLNDGSMQSERFTYIIAGEDILDLDLGGGTTPDPAPGETEPNGDPKYPNIEIELDGRLEVNVSTNGGALGTMWGEILLNDKRIGAFLDSSSLKGNTLYAGDQTRAMPGDIVEVKVLIPFSYSKKFRVAGRLPNLAGKYSLASITKEIMSTDIALENGVKARAAVRGLIDEINKVSAISFKPKYIPTEVRLLKDAITKNLPSTKALTMSLFGTDTAAINAVVASGRQMLNHAINHSNGNIIAWHDGAVRVVPNVKAWDIYPRDQLFTSNGEAGTWRLNTNKTLTKIS